MSLFKKVEDVVEEKDTLGGGSKFGVWNTGVYDVVIDSVYLDESKGGAYSMNFVFKTKDGKELTDTEYVTGGKAKGQLNYYTKDGKKYYLPGYNIANAIAFAATGKELPDLVPEDKIVEIYNYDLKKKTPTTKKVYMDLIGKSIKLGVFKVKEFKRVKDDSTGDYVDSDEVKELNEINKVFNSEGKTIIEAKAGSEAKFINEWSEKYNSEFVKDKTKGKTPATKSSGSTTTGSTPSLFGN
jgi:hypothetical protein